MDTPTETLIKALRQLSEDIQSEDGVANICVAESAQRLEEQSEKIKRLRDGIAKQNMEIEQTCGKALDYPWFKDDQKNFPGATEKDGVCVGDHVAETIAAELARKYTEAEKRIKRLEEAGDELTESSHSADDDIREHLQVANYNLHGLLNTGERITPPNPPKTVH
jgi:DNA repair exonuclease SbcCD ATPase subunit